MEYLLLSPGFPGRSLRCIKVERVALESSQKEMITEQLYCVQALHCIYYSRFEKK